MFREPVTSVRSSSSTQLFRYILNGVVATAVHYTILSLLVALDALPYAGLANTVAAAFGIASSFIGNRYFVFADLSRPAWQQLLRFLPIYAILALFHGVFLFFWTDIGGYDYRIGFLISVFVQFVCSYVANKRWVFSG